MSRDRFELVRQQFERALVRLHEALDQNETDFMRDALIQRFEFTYDEKKAIAVAAFVRAQAVHAFDSLLVKLKAL